MMPQTSAHRLRWRATPQDLETLADNPIDGSRLESQRLAIMQINSVTTAAPAVATKSSSTVAQSTAAKAPAAPPPQPSTPPPQAAAPPAESSASTASAATSTLVSSSYSTSAGGQSYSASISQANGTYTLSVPNLPGASVTASPLSAAEIALSVKVDTLV
jgi:hypothetical protein